MFTLPNSENINFNSLLHPKGSKFRLQEKADCFYSYVRFSVGRTLCKDKKFSPQRVSF